MFFILATVSELSELLLRVHGSQERDIQHGVITQRLEVHYRITVLRTTHQGREFNRALCTLFYCVVGIYTGVNKGRSLFCQPRWIPPQIYARPNVPFLFLSEVKHINHADGRVYAIKMLNVSRFLEQLDGINVRKLLSSRPTDAELFLCFSTIVPIMQCC